MRHRQGLRDGAELMLAASGLYAVSHMPDGALMAAVDLGLRNMKYAEGRDFVKTILLLAKRRLPDLAPEVQKSILNFITNQVFKGERRRQAFARQAGFQPPILFVVSPTMRCNLSCYGCYAGEYEKERDLGLGNFERILLEAEEMGIYFMTITGGEPFILGDDLLRIIERHRSILFQIYTNGTLIDEAVASRLAEVGNAFPCISVEGFEAETDGRRGKGSFEKVMRAMDALKRAGALFGFSATATRENNDRIVSESFVDFYRDKGCLIGWYFHYVPVGKSPGVEMMPTPAQRIHRREELVKRRERQDILLADFWNDGPLVGGCLAGGRRYVHINSQGDVEPCVFCHFAVDNIKDKSLSDILQSEFFTKIRAAQPYDDNLLRPCMIIDVPHVLRDVVASCKAHPTHWGAGAVLDEMADELDLYASEYGRAADEKWAELTGRVAAAEAGVAACGSVCAGSGSSVAGPSRSMTP